MEKITFKTNGATIRAELLDRSEILSRSTNKPLARIKIGFVAHDDSDKAVVQGAQKEKILESVSGAKPVKWILQDTSLSFTVGQDATRHEWTLVEYESLNVEKLIVGGIELSPYRYKEEFDNDALVITARFETTAEEVAKLRSLPKYFAVVRQGISAHEREMRYGGPLWSEKNGVINYQLTLVERT
jgi:hypothetical protein